MTRTKTCPNPDGNPDCRGTTHGRLCSNCRYMARSKMAEKRALRCANCRKTLARGTRGVHCWECLHGTVDKVERVLEEEAKIAPRLPSIPKYTGDWLILPDPHIPFHKPETIAKACKCAVKLGVRQLVIPGDLIHADMLSKYIGAGKLVKPSDELVSCGRVLGVLEDLFDKIVITMGNHDQRVEKAVARWRDSKSGRQALDIVAKILSKNEDAEDVSMGVFEHFFGSPKVTIHNLPEVEIDGFLVLHPGSASRVAPQNERKLVEKFRRSVVGGHTHLFAVGFDASGTDIAANIGHTSWSEKYRYIREKIGTFPVTVRGFAFLLKGRLLPLADHPKWFDLEELEERLKGESC